MVKKKLYLRKQWYRHSRSDFCEEIRLIIYKLKIILLCSKSTYNLAIAITGKPYLNYGRFQLRVKIELVAQ